jgi:GNAT superfamily N-acetyltransferase
MEKEEKKVKMPDGREVLVREPEISRDLDHLIGFYKKLPAEIQNYLRYETSEIDLCHARLEQVDGKNHWRVIAEIDGKVVGDGTMDREPFGWTRHMAELRIVVSPEFQNLGIGSVLLNRMVEMVAEARVERVFIEVLKKHQPIIKILEKKGFACDGVLKQRARDLKGRLHDVVFMSNDLEKVWRNLADYLDDMDMQLSRIHRGA